MNSENKPVTSQRILSAVCEVFGISKSFFLSTSRDRVSTDARTIFLMMAARYGVDYKYKAAKSVGLKEKSVYKILNRGHYLSANDEVFRKKLDKVEALLNCD